MSLQSPPISIYACLPKHLPQVLDIYNHYIENTVVTFDTDVKPLTHIQERYDAVLEGNLPYLVALLPQTDTVVGYAYTSQLRPRAGYAGSIEIAIYLHPSHKRQGLGGTLLEALLQKLREIPKSQQRPHGVREVFAIVTLDPDNDIRPFYRSFGFEQVAHLKNVGWKFERWWDTTYGQLSFV